MTHTSTHTPGPWQAMGGMIVVDPYGKVIAHTDVSMQHPPKRYVEIAERKANECLIVAAPEMLAALELWAYINLNPANLDGDELEQLVYKAEKSTALAIAKARGQS